MPVKDLGEIARRIREEIAQRAELRFFRAARGYEEVWGPVSPESYRRAALLVERLRRELAGLSFLDVYPGQEVHTPYGPVLVLEESRPIPGSSFDADLCRAHLKRALRLLYGVGEATERRLRDQGYETLEALMRHPRWYGQAEQLLRALQEGDLLHLYNLVTRWYSSSHPLSLALLGLLREEDLLLLDIETLGLSMEPIILLGLGRIHRGTLTLWHLVVQAVEEELAALALVAERLAPAQALVTYNGRTFDLRYLEARMAFYGLHWEAPSIHFDLLHYARRQFRGFLPNLRLETVEGVLGVERVLDIPSALVPQFYLDYLQERNIGPLVAIIEHNRQDLVSLALLLGHLWEEMVVRGL